MFKRWSFRLFGMALLLTLGVGGLSTFTQAEVPMRISYQGVLFDPDGMPMAGSVTIKVALWDDPNAGNLLYDEKHTVVLLQGGRFELSIGSSDPFDASLFLVPNRYLEVTIDGERMTPRQRFDSVPFALHTETVGGVALTGLVQKTELQAELLSIQNQLDTLKSRLDSILPCGNGVIDGDPLESCDGADLGGQICRDFGFPEGTLACDPVACTLDTSGCSECGNGIAEGPEACDGDDDAACPGQCAKFCTCAVCGDGLVEASEQCEGPPLPPARGNACLTVGAHRSAATALGKGPRNVTAPPEPVGASRTCASRTASARNPSAAMESWIRVSSAMGAVFPAAVVSPTSSRA